MVENEKIRAADGPSFFNNQSCKDTLDRLDSVPILGFGENRLEPEPDLRRLGK